MEGGTLRLSGFLIIIVGIVIGSVGVGLKGLGLVQNDGIAVVLVVSGIALIVVGLFITVIALVYDFYDFLERRKKNHLNRSRYKQN